MEELKCCPFCGGEAEIYYHPREDEGLYAVYIFCKHCDASSRPFLNEKIAIEAWNRRVDNG